MLKRGQSGFSTQDRTITFASNQHLFFSIKKPNQIKKQCLVLKKQLNDVIFYNNTFQEDYLINEKIVMLPNGVIKVIKLFNP